MSISIIWQVVECSENNLQWNQNVKTIEYPSAASRRASPKLDANGVRSIEKAIGVSRATPESG